MTANEEIIRLKIQLGLCQAEYQKEHAKFEAAERLLIARESVVAELEIVIKEAAWLMKEVVSYRRAIRELRGYATRFEELNGRLKQRPASMDDPDL
jgi:hypothetical protein